VIYLFAWDSRATLTQDLRLLCRNAVGDPLLPNGASCISVRGKGVIGEALRPCVSIRVEQPSPGAQTQCPSLIGTCTSIVPRISVAFFPVSPLEPLGEASPLLERLSCW
jgi:hypothetical protein